MGFKCDRFRTLVSMVTDSSHRLIMEKGRHHVISNIFNRFFSYLQVTMSSKFGRIRQQTTALAALEHMKKSHRLIMGKTISSHFLR